MKRFERLITAFICPSLSISFDHPHFTYRCNRTDDAINHDPHPTLTHLDSGEGELYSMWLMFIDSVFNTVVPHRLVYKFRGLGLNPSLCRPQVVRIRKCSSSPQPPAQEGKAAPITPQTAEEI